MVGHPVIDRDQDRYVLDPRHVDTDVWQTTKATTDATTATSLQVRDAALRQVIDTYRDVIAAGKAWPWLEAPREQARRHVLTAYTVLADHSPAEEALILLYRAMRIDPLNEDLVRRAARVHAAAGDTSALTDLLTAYRHRLSAAGLPPVADVEAWTQSGPSPG